MSDRKYSVQKDCGDGLIGKISCYLLEATVSGESMSFEIDLLDAR